MCILSVRYTRFTTPERKRKRTSRRVGQGRSGPQDQSGQSGLTASDCEFVRVCPIRWFVLIKIEGSESI